MFLRQARGLRIGGQNRVEWFIGSTVLLGLDVFNVMRETALLLAKQAVFASVTRPLANQLSCGGVHQEDPFDPSNRFAFNLRTAMKSSALM